MEKPWLEQCFIDKLNFIYDKKTDCTFLVGMKGEEEAKEIKSFKLVLSSISPVFERMFKGNFKEANSNDPIAIEDIYFLDFELFLKFVYGFNTNVTDWKSLYKIAKKYMADGIIAEIIKELELAKKTPLRMFYLFDIIYSEKKSSKTYTFDHNDFKSVDKSVLKELIETPRPQVFNLGPNQFLWLMRYLKPSVSVIKMLPFIENYFANAQFVDESEKAKFKAGLVKEINFSEMTAKQFATFDTNLLEVDEKWKILANLCL